MVGVRSLRAAAVATVVALALAGPAAHATPPQPATWNFSQIRIGQSQAAGRDGAGVTVAVVDTWIDRTHPDFGGRVLTGADCTGGTCKTGNVPADQCEAHGTHVAGTIASETYGVAPSAKILPLRILKWDGSDCTGTSRDLAAAVRYATAHGARVVNISAGASIPIAGRDATLDDAVAAAAEAGVLVVFAAGNANLPLADSYGDDALIVAATARDGQLASYSQYGAGVDLAAPGGDSDTDTCTIKYCVVSTWSDGVHHQYAALAGTSMAAPHVAGIAALLFAQRARTRDDVMARLRNTARPLANAGDGLVDATAALGVTAVPTATTTAAPPPTQAPILVKPKSRPAVQATPSPTKKPAKKPGPSPTVVPPTETAPPVRAEPPPAVAAARGPERTVPVTAAVLLLLVTATGTAAGARRQL